MVQSPRRASTAAGRIMSRTMVYTASPFATEIASRTPCRSGGIRTVSKVQAFAVIVSFECNSRLCGRISSSKGLRRS